MSKPHNRLLLRVRAIILLLRTVTASECHQGDTNQEAWKTGSILFVLEYVWLITI